MGLWGEYYRSHVMTCKGQHDRKKFRTLEMDGIIYYQYLLALNTKNIQNIFFDIKISKKLEFAKKNVKISR